MSPRRVPPQAFFAVSAVFHYLHVTDQLAMARLGRASFALMLSILPATATVIGLVVPAQVPTFRDLAGVGLISAGVHLSAKG